MGTFSIWHWLVVLIIVVLVFGTKKLRNLGGDLGSAIKSFKEGMKDSEGDNKSSQTPNDPGSLTFDDDIRDTGNTSANTFKEGVKAQEAATANTNNEPSKTAETTQSKEKKAE